MFFLVEVTTKLKTIKEVKSYRNAIDLAMDWSAKTGLPVEIQTESREVIDTVRSWADRDIL
jgi:tryptophan synthase alpha subunit